MDEYIAIYGNEKSIVILYCYGLLLWLWSIVSLIKSIVSLIKSIVYETIDHNNRLFISMYGKYRNVFGFSHMNLTLGHVFQMFIVVSYIH